MNQVPHIDTRYDKFLKYSNGFPLEPVCDPNNGRLLYYVDTSPVNGEKCRGHCCNGEPGIVCGKKGACRNASSSREMLKRVHDLLPTDGM